MAIDRVIRDWPFRAMLAATHFGRGCLKLLPCLRRTRLNKLCRSKQSPSRPLLEQSAPP